VKKSPRSQSAKIDRAASAGLVMLLTFTSFLVWDKCRVLAAASSRRRAGVADRPPLR
jgi:hypothetical protein